MTSQQRCIATQLDISLEPGDPRPVAAARLADAIAGPLGLKQVKSPSARQLDYLAEVWEPWMGVGPQYEMTRRTASAWIQHFLTLRSVAALEEIKPRRGDLIVVSRPDYGYLWDSSTPAPTVREAHVVSSVSLSGRVNVLPRTDRKRLGDEPGNWVYSKILRRVWPAWIETVAHPDEAVTAR